MVRPERFELPTYCSGVILGRLGLVESELQMVGNSDNGCFHAYPLLPHLSR